MLSVDLRSIDTEQEVRLNLDYSHFVTPVGPSEDVFKPTINIHSNLIVRAKVI